MSWQSRNCDRLHRRIRRKENLCQWDERRPRGYRHACFGLRFCPMYSRCRLTASNSCSPDKVRQNDADRPTAPGNSVDRYHPRQSRPSFASLLPHFDFARNHLFDSATRSSRRHSLNLEAKPATRSFPCRRRAVHSSTAAKSCRCRSICESLSQVHN